MERDFEPDDPNNPYNSNYGQNGTGGATGVGSGGAYVGQIGDLRNGPNGPEVWNGTAWVPYTAAAPPTATQTGTTAPPPPSTGGGDSGTGDIVTAPLTRPYDQVFTAPTPLNIGGPTGIGETPVFTPPTYTPPPAFNFKMPTADEALNDPGYQFRVNQGRNARQSWAAAKGTLNDSSTAKALEDYGQNAASQEYANVWNRDWQSQLGQYEENYKTQYTDPYAIAFGGAQAAFAPQMTGYQTNAAQVAHVNDTDYLNARNLFLQDRDYFSNWQDRVFNKKYQTATG